MPSIFFIKTYQMETAAVILPYYLSYGLKTYLLEISLKIRNVSLIWLAFVGVSFDSVMAEHYLHSMLMDLIENDIYYIVLKS